MKMLCKRIFAYVLMLCIIFGGIQFSVLAEKEKATLQDIEDAINLTLGYYRDKSIIELDWEAVSINAVGGEVNTFGTYGLSYIDQLKKKIKTNGIDIIGKQMTDYERTSLGILSAGEDPTDFQGVNLIDKIAEWPNLSQGINAGIWGLIAFDAANAKIPEGAVNTRESLIDYILKTKAGTGWSYGGTEPDPDMTGMALYALAPYRERLDVKKAGEAAIQWLSENQKDTGGYASWGTWNSESISQVILGITAWGVDPQGEKFTKDNGNAVTALLEYQIKTGADKGMFMHTTTPDAVFATPQGLQALAALRQYYDKGFSTVFYHIVTSGGPADEITGLTLSPYGLELEQGKTFELGLKNQRNFFISNDKAQWSTDRPEIASVDENGVLTAKKTGEVNVTAVLKTNPPVNAYMQVKVVESPFIIEDVTDSPPISGKKGIKVKLTNKTEKEQNVLCIAGLYEKGTGRLDKLNYIEKTFKAGEIHVFEAEFDVAEAYKNNYEIRVLIWENWSKARPFAPAYMR